MLISGEDIHLKTFNILMYYVCTRMYVATINDLKKTLQWIHTKCPFKSS